MAMAKTKTKTKSRIKATGNCFESALHVMHRLCVEGQPERYRLVHAEIVGQGPIEGVAHGHAFVVDVVDEVAYDESNGRTLRMDVGLYEAIARIPLHQNTCVYTWEEAVEKACESGHYGPWDLVTSTGL